jgi:formamidopyrimidine-DNA glycosylase
MWFELDQPESVIVHLGMSGQFRIHEPAILNTKAVLHPHVRMRCLITLPMGRQWEIHFIDQRTFGGFHFSNMQDDDRGEPIPTALAQIARDPFDPYFDPGCFLSRARKSQTAIKRLLLDQTAISGVGNIYADESLFRTGIHGERTSSDISPAILRKLVTNVTDVMNEALEQGGTSFDSLYVNVNGQSGYFSRSLGVYGREGEPCVRCGTRIKRKKFTNRSSFFCPKCQVAPAAVAHG